MCQIVASSGACWDLGWKYPERQISYNTLRLSALTKSSQINTTSTTHIMAVKLTNEQMSEFKRAFSFLDKDGDGFITSTELEAGIRSLSLDLTEADLRNIMDVVDADGNGSVDFREFLVTMTNERDENQEIREAFKVLDRDNDGFISAEELKTAMIRLGERGSDEEVEEMIREADTDMDGQVSYQEFVQMMSIK